MVYDTSATQILPEYCDVASIIRRTGGFNLVTSNLVLGSIIYPLAPLFIDFAARTATVIKNAKVYENAAANATAIKIKKNSKVYVGQYLGKSGKAAAITAINTSNSAYDLITISLGIEVVAGDVLYEASEPASGVNAVKGKYVLTVGTNPTAGDKMTVNGIEYEFAATDTENKITVGTASKDTAKNLEDVLEKDNPDFFVTASVNKLTFTQKTAGVGAIPTLVVTAVPSTGTLAATIEQTVEGVAGVASNMGAPKYACNGLSYASVKVGVGETIDAIAFVMEVKESELVIPVSAEDKAALGARYDFI